MTPLYHDLSKETVLVFGGGSVGSRKAIGFADEAHVIVVSPAFADRLLDAADNDTVDNDTVDNDAADNDTVDNDAVDNDGAAHAGIDLIRASPGPGAVWGWIHRVSPALVVAATDQRAVNAAAETAALESGTLVNRTDVSGGRDAGSVVVPATIEDDPVSVAISTGGASPALSKALRQRLEAEIDGAGAMAELSGELRRELSDRGIDPETRREAIRHVVRSEGVWKGLQKGRSNGRQEAYTVIEEVIDR